MFYDYNNGLISFITLYMDFDACIQLGQINYHLSTVFFSTHMSTSWPDEATHVSCMKLSYHIDNHMCDSLQTIEYSGIYKCIIIHSFVGWQSKLVDSAAQQVRIFSLIGLSFYIVSSCLHPTFMMKFIIELIYNNTQICAIK